MPPLRCLLACGRHLGPRSSGNLSWRINGASKINGAQRLFATHTSVKAEPSKKGESKTKTPFVNLPPPRLAETNILYGCGFGGLGVAVGAFALGGVVPAGALLGSLVPMALGTVYMPRDQLHSRALVTSSACLPIGAVASGFLEMAAWPVFGTGFMVLAPAMAAGYSCFHIASSQETDMDLISRPTSPFGQGLLTIGLWNKFTPWAHQPFRDTFKLFFWYSCLGTLPAACSLYGGYSIWLGLVLAWEWSIYISSASMATGFFLTSVPSMIPMEHRGSVQWLLPAATSWGNFFLDNAITHAMWIYSFYAFLPMLGFMLWYKWTNGVGASPFESDVAPEDDVPRAQWYKGIAA